MVRAYAGEKEIVRCPALQRDRSASEAAWLKSCKLLC